MADTLIYLKKSQCLLDNKIMAYIVKAQYGRYIINDVSYSSIFVTTGNTIIFDVSHSSNADHPLKISTTKDGTHGVDENGNPGTELNDATAIVNNGVPGEPNAQIMFTPALDGIFYYYCEHHANMGSSITSVQTKFTDLGATAYDAQDGDITNRITKKIYKKDENNVFQLVASINDSHGNPWEVSNIDITEQASYKIEYNAKGLDNIDASNQPLERYINIIKATPTGVLTIQEIGNHTSDVPSYLRASGNFSVGFGVWGWYGMSGLTQGPTPASDENNHNSSVINSTSLSGFLESTLGGTSISIEVPLNTWIMIYAEGKYQALNTGDVPSYYSYWCGNPYYEKLYYYTWERDDSRREQMIVDANYENGSVDSRIRFPGPNITNWNEYDADFLYPPGTSNNGGSINVHAFKGFNGEYERWKLQDQQYYYWRHNLNNNWNMAVFKILDSVTVNLNFHHVYYGL